MKNQFRILINTLPAISIYIYLAILAVTSTSMFIFLLSLVS